METDPGLKARSALSLFLALALGPRFSQYSRGGLQGYREFWNTVPFPLLPLHGMFPLLPEGLADGEIQTLGTRKGSLMRLRSS